jgi:hypothetical protein
MWDATQLHLGARALLAGQDPYRVVGERFPWPLFYPLTAVVLFVPIAFLPLLVARLVWAALQGAVFAYAGMRRGPPFLIGFLSGCYLDALMLGQLSPFLTAAAVIPQLGFVWAAKPSIGLALLIAYPSRVALLGGAALTLASLIVLPSWPALWLAALRDQYHLAPILRPGGVLLLLALLRWRSAEGRLLGMLALVPQTTAIYDLLPLFLIPRSRRAAYGLAIGTLAVAFLSQWLAPFDWSWSDARLREVRETRWLLMLSLAYLPALWLVLRRRAAQAM